jgi:hypothetical protein
MMTHAISHDDPCNFVIKCAQTYQEESLFVASLFELVLSRLPRGYQRQREKPQLLLIVQGRGGGPAAHPAAGQGRQGDLSHVNAMIHSATSSEHCLEWRSSRVSYEAMMAQRAHARSHRLLSPRRRRGGLSSVVSASVRRLGGPTLRRLPL